MLRHLLIVEPAKTFILNQFVRYSLLLGALHGINVDAPYKKQFGL